MQWFVATRKIQVDTFDSPRNPDSDRYSAMKTSWATSSAICRSCIQRKQSEIRTRSQTTRPKCFQDGENFYYLGRGYPLESSKRLKPPLILNSTFSLAESARKDAAQVFKEWYRERCREVVTARAIFHAQRLSLRYQNIRITSARTRWGSCSSKGNLNFSWRLVMAPCEVIDYVVVHELCHLKEPNHSKKYWSRVAAAMPDYRSHRNWLKDNGPNFNIF